MTVKKVLFERGGLELALENAAQPDVAALLADTVWGTPGGIRYRHPSTEERLPDLPDPWFMTLRKGDNILGTMDLDRRHIRTGGHALNAFYIRYFAMATQFQRNTTVSQAREASENKSQGMIKSLAMRIFQRPAPLYELTGTDHAVFYAYVELENERSQQMVKQVGFEPVGKFTTRIFSRRKARKAAGFRRLRHDEQAAWLQRLEAYYQDYAFFNTQSLFYRDHCYVIEHNGEIMAGLTAHPTRWIFESMPGLSGKVIMRVLPRLPYLKQLFNPSDYRFVAVEGIYCPPGHEAWFQRLLESVLAEHQLTAGLIWLDLRDDQLRRMDEYLKWGLVQKMNSPKSADIVMRCADVSEDMQQACRDLPVVISAFDAS